MKNAIDRVLGLANGQKPRPNHPVYEVMGFVPYDARTPAFRPGAYVGEPAVRLDRALSRAAREGGAM